MCRIGFRVQGFSRQFKATSPDLTLDGGLYREQYPNGLTLGIEFILNYLGLGFMGFRV